MDAVGIYVHKDNPLQGLSLEQLDAIFSTTRKRGYPQALRSWNQLGLGKNWEQAIHLYGRNLKSGTRGFVKESVLLNGEFDSRVQEEPGAASVILALSRDPFGMAYSGIGLATSSVRAVPLSEQEGKPLIEPNAETVMNGSYPLRRLLYLLVDKTPGGSIPPLLEEFLSFVKSRDGQETAMKTGFYPLTNGQLERAVAAVMPELHQPRAQ
jgi:phosphate transport system substrate-binding protein